MSKDPKTDDITEVATRVINGTATPEEIESVALWSIHVSKWIRALAAKEQR